MHELSVAYSIVAIVEEQAKSHQASYIEEVELEIGCLSGVEVCSLNFALESAVKGTMLERAKIVRHDIKGEGCCGDCGSIFPVDSFFSSCPSCGSYAVKIIKGKELHVKSIVIK